MKPLKTYLEDCQNKYNFEYNADCTYTFEDFCRDNKVDFNDREMYEAAVTCFDEQHWTYNTYDQMWPSETGQELFYETLAFSMEGLRLEEYIQKNFQGVISTSKANSLVSDKRYAIIIRSEQDLANIPEWISTLNLFNYSCVQTYKDNEVWIYRIKPNISQEMTESVYKENYLYHITAKLFADKIIKTGFQPKPYKHLRFSKTYFFMPSKSLEINLRSQFSLRKRLENWPDIPEYEPVVFWIDLSKLSPKPRFFKDSEYTGVNAVYTFEPISPRAVEEVTI